MGDALEESRRRERPQLPEILKDATAVEFSNIAIASAPESLKSLFPNTYGQPLLKGVSTVSKKSKALCLGVVFSGGQAPGGHTVIASLFDTLKALHSSSRLFGFLDGPAGIIENRYKELTKESIDLYRNQGGFELLCSGRTKIETKEQFQAALAAVQTLKLDGLVIIGGDDSNTNAAVLAEYFLAKNCPTKVIGVPKTIDGDLRNPYLEISFGFDTACKIYAEMIGNLCRDALSAKKYYHFVKLMGRSASHIALECALATHPNLTLIGEEIAAKKTSLKQITSQIADLICARFFKGKEYGVILIPEGLVEFIPEVSGLIKELNALVGLTNEEVKKKLTPASLQCFSAFPDAIQQQLLLERDPHGNVSVSAIETEELLIHTVAQELKTRKAEGAYKGKFTPIAHFFGYEGRAGFPSLFDCRFCAALGCTAALLIAAGMTGYMATVQHLTQPVHEWGIGAIPLTALMHIEMRKGEPKPVIQKALVNLEGNVFRTFAGHRKQWEQDDSYCFPGPIQFFGPPQVTDTVPRLLF